MPRDTKAVKELQKLIKQYDERDRRTESDCAVTERIWMLYRDADDKEMCREAMEWFVERIKDKKTNDLARTIICWHLYRTRKDLPKKERKLFREALRQLPRRKRELLKLVCS